jgi:hypothetical protein
LASVLAGRDRTPAPPLARFNTPCQSGLRALPFAARDVDSLAAPRLVPMKRTLAHPEHAGTLEEMVEAVLVA